MDIWLIVLLYSIMILGYLVLHQVLFRYSFKQLVFTLAFLNIISFVVMIASGFEVLWSWIFGVNAIAVVLVGIYIGILMRVAQDKLRTKMVNNMSGIEEMLKGILSNPSSFNPEDLFKGTPFADFANSVNPSKKEQEVDDIIVDDSAFEESQNNHQENQEKMQKFYENEDIIIDEHKNNNKDINSDNSSEDKNDK